MVTLLLLVAISSFPRVWSSEPGLKARLSQPGIQYAANVATDILKQQITTMKIPDQSGSSGHKTYTLTNIRVQSFEPPQTTVTTNPFRWTLTGTSAYLVADWSYRYTGLIPVRDHGWVEVNLGLNLDVTIALDRDNTGRPRVRSQRCDSQVTKVDVHFHGGASWIYNLFDHIIEHKIRDLLQDKTCEKVNELINIKVESRLALIPVELDFNNTVILDYTMIGLPSLTTKYIEFPVKGEFYWKTDKQEYPFPPKPLPQGETSSRMLEFWIGEYTINSLGYTEYKHGALAYNLSKADLSPKSQFILDTTCASVFEPCIGGILPKLGKLYPNASVSLAMTVTEPPLIHVAPSGINGDWVGGINFNVQTKNGSVYFLFSTNIKVIFNMEVIITGAKIKTNITEFKVNMTLDKSNIGEIDIDKLNFIMDAAINQFIIPKLDELGMAGMDLPAMEEVQYVNPTIKLLQQAVYIGTDLKYIG